MSEKKRKSIHKQNDFKRIKAKVGKRAAKAQNLTETSFKVASLHIAGQSVENTADGSTLASSRGRSLAELISQSGHPASAVRHSALKGLGNVIAWQSAASLRPHISSLLNVCAKSLVDEEEDVRRTALSVLEHLIQRFDEATISPFAPLLAAYVNSALHSLVPQMRVDGSRAINIISKCYPSVLEPRLCIFIPAFTRLLADRKIISRSLEDVLRGLIALLRCSKTSLKTGANNHISNFLDQDLVYRLGGRSQNALFFDRRGWKRSFPLSPFHTADDVRRNNHVPGNFSRKENKETKSTIYDLLVQIRDVLVETTQEPELSSDHAKTAQDEHRIIIMLDIVRLAWKAELVISHSPFEIDPNKNILKLSQQIIKVALEWLPDQNDMTVDEDNKRILSTSICDTILQMVSSISFFDSDSSVAMEWVKPILEFLANRLNTESWEWSIDLLGKLITFLSHKNEWVGKILPLMKRLQEVFFGDHAVFGASEPARKAVLVAERIIVQNGYDIEDSHFPLNKTLQEMVMLFPLYLHAWRSKYYFESESVLSLLVEVSRRCCDPASSPLLARFRSDIGKIAVRTESNTKGRALSIFEAYPLRLQKLYLELIVLLGSPSSETLNGLSAACSASDSSVPAELRDEIIDSVHAIRRTLPLRTYLSFLVDCIGIPSRGKTIKQTEKYNRVYTDCDKLLLFDSRLERVTQSLFRCGSSRSLEMLLPQLQSWLEPHPDTMMYFLRNRCCVAIIAALLLDMKVVDQRVTLFAVAPGLIDTLAAAICQALKLAPLTGDAMERETQLMSPYHCLLQSESAILVPVFLILINRSKNERTVFSDLLEGLQIFSDILTHIRFYDGLVLEDLLGVVRSLKVDDEGCPEGKLLTRIEKMLECLAGSLSF